MMTQSPLHETARKQLRHKKIGVLCGGRAPLRSGGAVNDALTALGYDAEVVVVDAHVDLVLRQKHIDVAFVASTDDCDHGGSLQGLLSLVGIAYTGSDLLGASLAMDRAKAKQLFRLHNLPTLPFYMLDEKPSRLSQASTFGYPVMVSPNRAVCGTGQTVVHSSDELLLACETAFLFDDTVLVERAIEGIRLSVGIVNDAVIGVTHGGKCGEPRMAGLKGRGAPAIHSSRFLQGVTRHALAAHKALGCRGATTVDMLLSTRDNEYVLAVNAVPELARDAALPAMAHMAGIDYPQLIESILLEAWMTSQRNERGDRRRSPRGFAGPNLRASNSVDTH